MVSMAASQNSTASESPEARARAPVASATRRRPSRPWARTTPQSAHTLLMTPPS